MKKPTLLLLHGWNWKNYSKFGNIDPWNNRLKFIQELEKIFDVIYMSFSKESSIQELKDISENVLEALSVEPLEALHGVLLAKTELLKKFKENGNQTDLSR